MPVPDARSSDPYTVLGVDRNADDKTIASAHRRLARRHHPDLAGESATRQMIRINAAFEAIRNDAARAEYAAARKPPPPRDGTGGAGRPPGRPSGSILDFGRHIGWSLGEIARVDPGYLVWLADRTEGEPYRDEIDDILVGMGIPRRREYAGADRWNRFGRS